MSKRPTVDTPGDYKYYKLLITQASGSDTYLGFREIDLIGVDYTPVSDFNMLVILDENNATFKSADLDTPSVRQMGRTCFSVQPVPS